jgi:hypothetical protein
MNFLSSGTILNDDFVWDVISNHILNRHRGTGGAAFNMNCPMCITLGQTPDKTYRCGVFHTANGIGVNCFNCQFKTGYKVGNRIGRTMAMFLDRIGVPDREVKLLKRQALQLASFKETVVRVQPEFHIPNFDVVTMPSDSQSLEAWDAADCQDQNYLDVVRYILTRGDVAAMATTYYWSPNPEHGLNRKLLIPCWYEDRLVGWIGRCIDPSKRKYYNQIPKHFLFNSKCLNHPHRKYIFIVEGVFDALVIDGVAALGSNFNQHQISWIKQCDKIPIVIPDRDEAGKGLINIALQQEWAVAFPNYGGRCWWNADIKDVDEAVLRHGKLFTVRSIIESMTNNSALITQRSHYHL